MRSATATHQYDYFPEPTNLPYLRRLLRSSPCHCIAFPVQALPVSKQQYFLNHSSNRKGQQRHDDHHIDSDFNRPHNDPLRHASTNPATNIIQLLPETSSIEPPTANHAAADNPNDTPADDNSDNLGNVYNHTKYMETLCHHPPPHDNDDYNYYGCWRIAQYPPAAQTEFFLPTASARERKSETSDERRIATATTREREQPRASEIKRTRERVTVRERDSERA